MGSDDDGVGLKLRLRMIEPQLGPVSVQGWKESANGARKVAPLLPRVESVTSVTVHQWGLCGRTLYLIRGSIDGGKTHYGP